MYEREQDSRKWKICSLFTVCAIFSAVVGGMHTYRALNARKLNSYQQYYSRDEFLCKSDEEGGGYCYGNNYDSCLVPTYLYGNADSATIEDAYSNVEEWCDGDQDCLQAGTRWTMVWESNAAMMFL